MSSTALDVRAPDLPVPTFNGAQMERAIVAYRELQATLDRQMPDAIQKVGDRHFRKKAYWRAVAVAFGLNVECTREEQYSTEDEWGYRVTYRVTTKTGRTVDGDGACGSDEKRGNQATEHNVRSHAHTRAFNRAVSNAVGFGEVSAEEVEHEAHERPRSARAGRRETVNTVTGEIVDGPRLEASITRQQFDDLLALATKSGWKADEFTGWLKEQGYASALAIPASALAGLRERAEMGAEFK